jgi:hypothetical protein
MDNGQGGYKMYYRRQLPIMSGVYRSLPTRRFVMMTMGGYWPVIDKLPNGHLGVVTRDGDFHVGARGRLVFVTSPDGGESWSHATVISQEGSDSRNPAFGVTADGTLLASFIRQVNYKDGVIDASLGLPTPLYISRSDDNGATWDTSLAKVDGKDSCPVSSPFGRMITLADGTVLMTYYYASAVYIIRSHDGGHTWVDPVEIAGGGYNETSICDLGGDRLLVLMRDNEPGAVSQSDSQDGGYTWSKPRLLTGPAEHPADVIKLQDGRLLMTYGRRVTPWGILGMLSDDDGKTWNTESRIMLVADNGTDHGYPSNVQRDDGTIVTVYYSSELHIPRRPRPEVMGIHGAAVHYRPEDL